VCRPTGEVPPQAATIVTAVSGRYLDSQNLDSQNRVTARVTVRVFVRVRVRIMVRVSYDCPVYDCPDFDCPDYDR